VLFVKHEMCVCGLGPLRFGEIAASVSYNLLDSFLMPSFLFLSSLIVLVSSLSVKSFPVLTNLMILLKHVVASVLAFVLLDHFLPKHSEPSHWSLDQIFQLVVSVVGRPF
jgi:hypothetical protein